MNELTKVSIVISLSIFVLFTGIFISFNHIAIIPLITTGNMFGNIELPPYEDMIEKARQTKEYVAFETKYKEAVPASDSFYLAKRLIIFESIKGEEHVAISFKISHDGSIGYAYLNCKSMNDVQYAITSENIMNYLQNYNCFEDTYGNHE